METTRQPSIHSVALCFLLATALLIATPALAQTTQYVTPVDRPPATTPVTQSFNLSSGGGELPELRLVEDRWCEEIEDFCPLPSYDFGTVPTGSSGPYLIALLHNQSESESATGLSILSDAMFPLIPDTISLNDCPHVNELPPGQFCRVRVKFAPTMSGPETGTLTATSVEGAEASVPLTGNGDSDRRLLYGQFHDWETNSSFFSILNASYGETPDFSSDLADDFEVEDPDGWIVTQIGLEVSMDGFEPDVHSVDVFIVPDNDGIPSDTATCTSLDSEILFWEAPRDESRVEMALSSPCKLPPGHYWLQVQPHVDNFFDFGGYYGWGFQYITGSEEDPPGEPPIHLDPPAWRNPGDGIETGCTEWTPVYPPDCVLEEWWPLLVAYNAVFWLVGQEGNAVALSVAPDSLDFGEVPVNESGGPASLTLTSVGSQPLTVSDVSVPEAPFTVGGGSCDAPPFTLTPEESCTLEITFAPTEEGSASDSLSIASDASSSPDIVILEGTGVEVGTPELGFEPSGLDFGEVVVGTTSLMRTAVLSNTGDAEATNLSFNNPDNGFAADTADCGGNLPPGVSCEVSVTLTPAAPGSASAVLEVSSDEGPATGLSLSGEGEDGSPPLDPIFEDQFEDQ